MILALGVGIFSCSTDDIVEPQEDWGATLVIHKKDFMTKPNRVMTITWVNYSGADDYYERFVWDPADDSVVVELDLNGADFGPTNTVRCVDTTLTVSTGSLIAEKKVYNIYKGQEYHVW